MYESYYSLDRAPFANIPDPDFLYLSPNHKRALSTLEYALAARAGFCVITGDVGAGKTTLVRSVLQRLDSNIEIGLVSNTQCDSFEEFLSWILLAFDLQPQGTTKVELYDQFVQYLIDQHKNGYPVTLIVDEAQHLGYKYLEQLRMLSNVNTEKGLLLQTILVGQPELWKLLRKPELEQFAQRISYDYFLEPLQDAQIAKEYVEFRLRQAGGDPDLFADNTYEAIWRATNGVPRLINLLCDTALLYGYAEEKDRIDLPVIEQVIRDKESRFSPIGKTQPYAEPQSRQRTSRIIDGPEAATRPESSHTDTPASSKAGEVTKLSTIERAARFMNKK